MNAKWARGMMALRIGFLVILISFMVAGCSSSQRKAHKAEAEYTKEKTKTLQQYKDCVKKAKGDEAKLQRCDALLKAIEAVEGTSAKPAEAPQEAVEGTSAKPAEAPQEAVEGTSAKPAEAPQE